ncbi:hypothetical protein [Carboxylicivirga sp. N1Y90]|uniref:hypothetical protein n=1 Tax=Carboxylicivirga fragile TaxID=3417571 RepID=UPI003D35125E|nr:hypothetical protein [Marinilabiliaceae bacterium N1Y90]
MRLYIYVIVVSLFFFSCTHQPDEYSQSELVAPPSDIRFDIALNVSSDTIIVSPYNDYFITYKVEDYRVLEARLMIDGYSVDVKRNDSDTLFFQAYDNFGDGTTKSTLKIEFDVKTNSGSVADKLDLEYYQLSKEFKLFLEHNYAPKIISNEVANGIQHLKWERFKGPDFKSYVISNGYGDQVAIINNPDITQLPDSSFVGYSRSYKLTTHTSTSKLISKYYARGKNQEVTVLPHIEGNLITWDKSEYFNAIDKYLIYERLYDSYEGKLIGEVGANETSFIHSDAKFATGAWYYLHAVSKSNSPSLINVKNNLFSSFNVNGSSAYKYAGATGYSIENVTCSSEGIIHSGSYLRLGKLNDDYEFKDVLDSKGGVCSSNAKYYLIKDDDNLKLYSSPDKTFVSEVNLKDLNLSDYGWGLNSWRISDNGIALIVMHDIHVYDMINQQLITSIKTISPKGFKSPLKISTNGEFVIFTDYSPTKEGGGIKMVKITDGQVHDIWGYNGICLYDFDYNNNDKFFAYIDGSLKSYSLDGVLIKSLYVGDLGLLSINSFQEEFLTINHNKNEFHIYNLSSGDLKHSVPTFKYDYNNSSHEVTLANKMLFWNRGYYMKLDY